MPDFKMLLETKEYEFLKTEPRLGRRILLLGLGGSYAYGTANENSDIDFRGVTLNLPSDLLGLTEFEQYEDQHTDTVIYSFIMTTQNYQISSHRQAIRHRLFKLLSIGGGKYYFIVNAFTF